MVIIKTTIWWGTDFESELQFNCNKNLCWKYYIHQKKLWRHGQQIHLVSIPMKKVASATIDRRLGTRTYKEYGELAQW